MAKLAVQPFVLKDVVMIVGTDDYARHVSTVRFDPSVQQQTWQGLSPDASFSDAGSATWTCTLAYAQDWTTPNSLAQYLLDNAGQTKTVQFSPRNGVGPTWTAQLTIVPGPIGGDVNTVQTGQVQLGVVGTPTRAPLSSPTLTAATPSGAGTGQLVQITGSGFTGASAVKFGSTNATSYTVASDTVITAVLPSGSAGSAPITVTTAGGTSSGLAYTRAA